MSECKQGRKNNTIECMRIQTEQLDIADDNNWVKIQREQLEKADDNHWVKIQREQMDIAEENG